MLTAVCIDCFWGWGCCHDCFFYFRREHSVGVFFSLLPPSISPLPHPVTCQLHIPALLSFSFLSSCMWPQITILYLGTRLFSLYHLCLILRLFSFCSHIILWSCHVIVPSSWAVVCLLICLQWRVFFCFSVHAMPGQVPKPCIPYPTHPGGSSPGSAVNAYSSFLDHCQSIQAQHGYDVVMARHTQIEMDHST